MLVLDVRRFEEARIEAFVVSAARLRRNRGADGGVRRWAKRLDTDQHDAYRRYCRAVLSGPLDQFAAGV